MTTMKLFLCVILLPTLAAAMCFTTIGDWGRSPDVQSQVAVGLGAVMQQMDCNFVVSTGDNIYDKGISSPDDPQMKEKFEDIYNATSLQRRWYITVGNHDYGHEFKGIEAQIAYTNRSTRWYFPSRYYTEAFSLDGGASVQFVFLDTVLFGQDEQKWAESVMKASNATYLMVVGHYPVYSGGEHGSVLKNSALHKMLEQYNATAYHCGHDHDLQYLSSNGIHYFVSGGGSSERDDGGNIAQTVFHSQDSGFLSCSLSSQTASCAFHNSTGDIIYQTSLSPRVYDVEVGAMLPPVEKDAKLIVSDEDEPRLRAILEPLL